MITTGVVGHEWRASVTAWGGIEPWDDRPGLDWYVAADDRWHVPAREPTVRQRRVDGTSVVETRVRVPNGDVVQRIYSVADDGGLTVVEVENDSTLPVAIAFDRRTVLTERPIADVPIEGIDLPAEAFVLPLGHRATVRVGVAHDGRTEGALPAGLPTATQVARGWTSLTERASRLVLPPGAPGSATAELVAAERCEVALGSVPRADDDPVGFAVALGELVRMGERPEPWLPELVSAIERIGPISGWDADAALSTSDRVLGVAGERRARRDLERIAGRRRAAALPVARPDGIRIVPWIETMLVRRGELLPGGLPTPWLGQSLEVYGMPTLGTSAVSFAIRWHGERPAVLWEQTGDAVELSAPALAPSWRTSDVRGDALWPAPPTIAPLVDRAASPTDEPRSSR